MSVKHNICQSCGMPLFNTEMHGTDACGIPVEDYCIHCYKDGGFTSEVTMEEMMRLCAEYVGGNRLFYVANMRTLYPHLKRWAGKEDTESRYYRSIRRVLDYVKSHLNENTSLHRLAEIAHISPYHFHRIFKSVIGESLGEYGNRLRMEYVAGRLKDSGLSLMELAEQTGYSSEQALSRAFKKYFDLPPKTFQSIYYKESLGTALTPRICRVAAKDIIILKEDAASGDGWNKLYVYAMLHRLLSRDTEHLEVADGTVSFPALTVDKPMIPDRHIATGQLHEGLYAIFTHKGPAGEVERLYDAARHYWFAKSKYIRARTEWYVVYLNNPNLVTEAEQLAEIYIPLEEKQEENCVSSACI